MEFVKQVESRGNDRPEHQPMCSGRLMKCRSVPAMRHASAGGACEELSRSLFSSLFLVCGQSLHDGHITLEVTLGCRKLVGIAAGLLHD